MDQLITLFQQLVANPTILVLLILLSAIVVAGMSVYGMTLAIKNKRGGK